MANPNIYALTDTRWSAAGTTYNAIWMDVNDGAAGSAVGAAASRLLKYTNNGTEVFGVNLAGYIRNLAGTKAAVNLGLVSDGSTGLYFTGGLAGFTFGNFATSGNFGTGWQIFSGAAYSITSGQADGTADVSMYRDATGISAFRVGTASQVNRIYNTFTDASNYERCTLDWQQYANILTLGSESLGTGVGRALLLKQTPITLASLPTPASVGSGARMFISDSTLPVIFTTAVGGGATPRPVFSNGTNWLCG